MAAIKISELSIGDRVLCEGEYWKISAINEESVGLRVDSDYSVASFEECDPIPLTPEILEKNGLCVVEEDADFSEYELFGSENFSIFHIKGTLHYRLETPQASVVCWNVHQLQHALRLAGVEKEIVV